MSPAVRDEDGQGDGEVISAGGLERLGDGMVGEDPILHAGISHEVGDRPIQRRRQRNGGEPGEDAEDE